MDRLQWMQLFIRVVETGSFSAVAREANIGQPAVSKQIAALESHLGAQLLQRNTRKLLLTDAGRSFYDSSLRLLADLEAAESQVGFRQLRPSGLLRVSVSSGFGRLHVVPLLGEFQASYPEITVELLVSDRYVDLIEEGVDIALRIGDLGDSSLTARLIARFPRITVAAPAYLKARGAPIVPDDLAQHDTIAFTFRRAVRPWQFLSKGSEIALVPAGALRTNDAEILRACVLAGRGIAQAPSWLFTRDLADGSVVELLLDHPGTTMPVHAVHAAGLHPPGKIRVFIDHLAACFGMAAR